MLSLRPLQTYGRRLIGSPQPDLAENARDRWQLAPGRQRHVPPAVHLPGQLERIRGTEFAAPEVVLKALRGGYDSLDPPTTAFRVENVDLVDGVLYARGRQRHLRARRSRAPVYRIPREVISATMYESWLGNRWFGNWLSDDCLTYLLVDPGSTAVTSMVQPTGHMPRYESLLGMTPLRKENVHFRELILFDDMPNNDGKTQRAAEMRRRLLAGRSCRPLPGVFILRGSSGDARVMQNEREIAEQMARTYGFHLLDPMAASVDEIADLCGAAAIVAGVEGSHLVHGLATMPPGAALLVFQPPDRTVAALKTLTDRQDQRYALVVGEGSTAGFTVGWDDVRRTLDLLA